MKRSHFGFVGASLAIRLLATVFLCDALSVKDKVSGREAGARVLSGLTLTFDECPNEVVSAIEGNESELLEDLLNASIESLQDCEVTFEAPGVQYSEEVTGTALHYAANLGLDAVVKVLLAMGFSPTAPSTAVYWGYYFTTGTTPLMYAAAGGHLEVCQLLLDTPININHQSQDSFWTALLLAVAFNRPEAGLSALRLAVAAGKYFLAKLLLDNGATLVADIDREDTEGRQLAVWMGVEFSEARLVKPFIKSESSWAELWEDTLACVGDMKDKCTGGLMTHVTSATIIHHLLDWQFQHEKQIPSSDEEKIANHEIGLTSESKQAIDVALAKALENGKSEAALAFLSRGAWEEDDFRKMPEVKDISLQSQDSGNTISLQDAKSWNQLHWAAFSCDTSAVSLALKFPTQDLVKLLDSRPSEGEASTPFEIAEKNTDCIRCLAIFEELQADWSRQFFYRLFGGYFTAFACCGAPFFHLFFVRMQTLKRLGWTLMSAMPLLLALTGVFLVLTPTKASEGSISVTSDALQQGVGWMAITAGVLLFLGVCTIFVSPRLTRWFQAAKKKGNDKRDRFWDKTNCVLAWILMIVLLIEAGLIQQMGLGFGVVAPFAGFAHTAAATLPLLMGHPRRLVVCFHLAPGILLLGLVIYHTASADPDSSILDLASPEAFVLIATCLALASADAAGAVVKAVHRAISAGKELATKQDVAESTNKFAANRLILAKSAISAQGLEATLGLTTAQISEGLSDPIEAMRKEIVASGDQNDLENFTYIVEGVSGRKSDLPTAVAESLKTGIYHGGTIGPNDFDTGHDGRSLDDWMGESEVALAELTRAEFVAVRFYTSSSFPKINGPLRRKVRPHPWAMVVYLLDRGIKKLRSVQAQVNPQAFAGETTLWRGMKNLEVDLKEFAEVGGTEMAPMSTTTNEEVARHYAHSKVPLVFKYVVGGLKTGVSIRFLSLYPKEEEFLYAPLTFLTLKNHYEDDGTTILVVEPVMS